MYFTFILLADTFIQSDTVHSGYTFFCQYVCSLGIEPTTLTILQHFIKNFWRTKQLLVPNIDFHCGERNTIEVNEDHQLFD